jgi:hypothetical protein
MFWNARGVEEDLVELIVHLDENDIQVACIMETKVFGTDLSTDKYKWISGPETLPSVGGNTPRMGLGFLVSREYPRASLVRKGRYTAWLRIPGAVDLYVGAIYIPVYPQQKLEALKELWLGYQAYEHVGLVVMGGDLNARCGANGDAIVNTFGRKVLRECSEKDIDIVNMNTELVVGSFSREQTVYLKKTGESVVHRTTIDYVMTQKEQAHRVESLKICEDSGLNSDHKPLAIRMRWRHAPGGAVAGKARQFHYRWKLDEMTPSDWDRFEDCCDHHLARWMAQFEDRSQMINSRDSAARL